LYSDLTWKLGILDDWSLRRGGRLREVVVTGGSTVYIESNKRQCFIGKRVENTTRSGVFLTKFEVFDISSQSKQKRKRSKIVKILVSKPPSRLIFFVLT